MLGPGRFAIGRHALERGQRGRAIAGIAPKPFPGEDRAVRSEERRIGCRILPAGRKFLVRVHAARKAPIGPLTHSPIWGNCLVIADDSVPEDAGHELRPADHVIGRPRPLHILVAGLDADPEDGGNFPIRFARGEKPDALPFAPAEMRTARGRRIIVEPPRGPEGMGADLLGAKQTLGRKLGTGAHRERAGTGRLARHVDRHGEALADIEASAALESLAPLRVNRDQPRQLEPGKADIGARAGQMDRVGPDQAVRGKLRSQPSG